MDRAEDRAQASPIDMLREDLEKIEVPEDYDGPRWDGGGMTEEFIEGMLDAFKEDKRVHKKYLYKIILAAYDMHEPLQNIEPIAVRLSDEEEQEENHHRPHASNRLQTPQERLEKTEHACLSNILAWLFLVFPSVSFASMQAFGCREIANVEYLVADLRETCPMERADRDGTFWYSIVSTLFWTLGTLLVFYGSMKYYKVPEMATRKRNHAIINAMIGMYILKNADSRQQTDSSQQTQFTGTEKPADLTLRQLFALLTFKWERRMKETAAEDETEHAFSGTIAEDVQDLVQDRVQDEAEGVVLEIGEETASRNSSPVLTNLADANTHSLKGESVLRQVRHLCQELELELKINIQLIDWPQLFDDLQRALDSKLSTSSLELVTDLKHWVTELELRTCKDVLFPQAVQLGNELTKEGIITLSPLKWDGTLGDEEEKMLQSLGFLLDAYQVDSWSWELVEIARKLILTAILVVWFDGSEKHLAGSLLTAFVFILLHLKRRPYLNTGLNNFQTLALVTQFLTIFACIIFLKVGCLNQLVEAQPDSVAKNVAEFWGWVIVTLNWFTAIAYPAYCFYVLLTDSEISSSSTKSWLVWLQSCCCPKTVLSGNEEPEIDKKLLSILSEREVSEVAI